MAGPPGWAIYAAITGTALVLLLRQEPTDNDDIVDPASAASV